MTSETEGMVVLRIVTGQHKGAVLRLEDGKVYTLGSGKHNEIVLSDYGIADQHCKLVYTGGRAFIAAIDDPVKIGSKELAPDRRTRLMTRQKVALTPEVTFDVIIPGQNASTTRQKIGTIAAVAMGCVALLMAMPFFFASDSVANTGADTFNKPFNKPANTQPLDDPNLELIGEFSIDADTTNTQVSPIDPTKRNLALAVEEVFRMSGVNVMAQETESGVVVVDAGRTKEKRLMEIAGSRAIAEIEGLKQLEFTTPVTPPRNTQATTHQTITSIVRGIDPYLITHDGSRYFIGAELPCGTLLENITDQEVWYTHKGETKREQHQHFINNSRTSCL